jgi:hypothetical protein
MRGVLFFLVMAGAGAALWFVFVRTRHPEHASGALDHPDGPVMSQSSGATFGRDHDPSTDGPADAGAEDMAVTDDGGDAAPGDPRP